MAGNGRNSVYLTVGAPYTSSGPTLVVNGNNNKNSDVVLGARKSDYLLEEVGAQRSVYATETPKLSGKSKAKPRKLAPSAMADVVDDVAIMEKRTPRKKSTLKGGTVSKDEEDANRKPPSTTRNAPSTTPGTKKTSGVRSEPPSKGSKNSNTTANNGKKAPPQNQVRKKSTEEKNTPGRQKKPSRK